ncbi:MAG: hypothetical protein UU37_C0001G0032 [Candidatus Gottesmanbacteria bacterium GW2011_GWA2_41_12]|uniref:DUF1648 domain-containing protein n=1 Tax=Candidatus Gottesmanbacteria bacterium GW2011_GWA2_41_12 TaxID=1618440 RepID=A0A0G0UIK9_9BACT|nr:MAG: hypothetical protein UU37_C0001G0032 [Candidatus Gottesmanbacteria bacterium GW2011_GWA2_41_12]
MIKNRISFLVRDRFVKIGIIGNIILFFLFLAVLLARWRFLPPQLPLFYSLPRGEEQLGSSLQILILPIFSQILFVLNHFFALLIYKREPFLSEILSLVSLFLGILLFITFFKIIFLVS